MLRLRLAAVMGVAALYLLFFPGLRADETPELGDGQLKWSLTRYCRIVGEDGKRL